VSLIVFLARKGAEAQRDKSPLRLGVFARVYSFLARKGAETQRKNSWRLCESPFFFILAKQERRKEIR
jgi:hypothetical protein